MRSTSEISLHSRDESQAVRGMECRADNSSVHCRSVEHRYLPGRFRSIWGRRFTAVAKKHNGSVVSKERWALVALGVAQVQADNGSNRRENADGDEEEGKHQRSNPKAMPTSRHGTATTTIATIPMSRASRGIRAVRARHEQARLSEEFPEHASDLSSGISGQSSWTSDSCAMVGFGRLWKLSSNSSGCRSEGPIRLQNVPLTWPHGHSCLDAAGCKQRRRLTRRANPRECPVTFDGLLEIPVVKRALRSSAGECHLHALGIFPHLPRADHSGGAVFLRLHGAKPANDVGRVSWSGPQQSMPPEAFGGYLRVGRRPGGFNSTLQN